MKLESHHILGAPVRHLFMMGLIWHISKTKKEINILEIGSWRGASALTWAQGMKEHNVNGTLTCVDAWEPYETMTDEMCREGNVYEDFRKVMKHISESMVIKAYVGKSGDILPSLTKKFDLIYIDGDHTYNGVMNDIDLSLPLLAKDGIICGDDLNIQLHDVEGQIHDMKDRDTVTFHPGVTLAVHEQFGRVSSWGGLWAAQNSPNHWNGIDLRGMTIIYPEHFSEDKLLEVENHFRDIKY
jgi:predicted O-methyltransferase YrrM